MKRNGVWNDDAIERRTVNKKIIRNSATSLRRFRLSNMNHDKII